MFGAVLIPPAVASEIRSFPLPQWVTICPLPRPADVHPFKMPLGRGETEAIWLSVQLPADQLILDDAAARAEAGRHAILITGTLGILLAAKEAGLLTGVRKEMDALRAASFHISSRTYQKILIRAGEE